MEPIIIEISATTKKKIEFLMGSGLYGDTIEEVTKHLLLFSIRHELINLTVDEDIIFGL